jgi:hypothetical protein
MTLDKVSEIASEVLKRMALYPWASAAGLIGVVACERRYTITREDKNKILELIRLVVQALPAEA